MWSVYEPCDMLVLHEDLQTFAWSAPMRDLAAKVGLSDVGLKKLLLAHGISTPPQGYWNKLRAGKPVPDMPALAPRQPGQTGRIRVGKRFADFVPAAAPIPSSGPFASTAVPEDLEDLRAGELKALGQVSVPKILTHVHVALRPILEKENRRREKGAASRWAWDAPRFDNPIDRRRVRLFNAIFLTLAKRGHSGDIEERDGRLQARALVGDTRVGIAIEPRDRHRSAQRADGAPDDANLTGSTPLTFRLDPTFQGTAVEAWHDDSAGQLEGKMAAIVAAIITAGEASFRRRLRQEEIEAEQCRIAAEERRREQLAALNRERLENLFESGERLRQAEDLRLLIAKVATAVSRTTDIAAEEFAAWREWAETEADKLDPIRSGQFKSHLKPPSLDIGG